MELFTAATTVLTAIKAANIAYGAVKEAGSNFGEAWKAASNFLDAKATVDAYAEVDKQNKDLSTDAFINSILFARFEKEVEQVMLAFLKGEELKQWAAHKEAVREKARKEAEYAIERERQARIKARLRQLRFEQNVTYATWGFLIAALIAYAITATYYYY